MPAPTQGNALANTLITTGAAPVRPQRQDLADIIYQLDRDETPILSAIKKRRGSAYTAEWSFKALRAADTHSHPEGFEAAFGAVTRPTVLNNVHQIFAETFSVSETTIQIETARVEGTSAEDQYDIEKLEAAMEVKIDVEQQLASDRIKADGSSGNRQMGGIYAYCTQGSVGAGGTMPTGNGAAAHVSGTNRDLTLTLIATAMQAVYQSGGKPRMLNLTPALKRVFSGLAAGGTGNGFAADNIVQSTKPMAVTIVGAVDVYMTDFGPLQGVPNRHATAGHAALLDPDRLDLSHLQNFVEEKYAKTGNSQKGGIVAEVCVRVLNPLAHACIFDLN
jgi:hypothetical protein